MKPSIFLKVSSLFFTFVVLAWLISCAVNPVTGKREFMLLSESDEIALGKQTDEQVVQSYGIYEDPQLAAYIERLGQSMARLSHRPHLSYAFKLLDSPVINAFAVPGGYVYITRGILSYLNSEAELAGVMGHEIGHIAARHSAKQYSRVQLAQFGLGLGTILSEDFRKLSGLAQFGVGLLFLRFSRDSERQADRLGVEYSTKAGYNAVRMADFFITMEKMSPASEKGGLPSWFSTHPNPADRVVTIQQLAREWQGKLPEQTFKVNREAYLRTIEGLVYGEDPRQGYVENQIFYHPKLRFQFPVPDKWQLNNTPTQVEMYTEKKDAIILLTISSETTPRTAAFQFLAKSKASVQISEETIVNGLTAYRVISDLSTKQGTVRILSYFIQKGERVYVFHGYTALSQFHTYFAAFRETMEQFRHLSDPRKINVKPTRIQIKRVMQTMAVKEALLSFGVPDEKLKEVALINGRVLEETISQNSLLKVPIR